MNTSADLDELQALFWRAITWPTGVADFLAKADPATRTAFEAGFVDPACVSATQRLDVYANSYFWRLHGVLEENHPVIAWLLGAARFRNLATDYVLAHPSTNADLRSFSRALPAFLVDRDALPPPSRAVLAQIAQVELHVGDLLHAPDEPSICAAHFDQLPPQAWPGLRLELGTTIAFVTVEADYIELDAARRRDDAPPPMRLDADGTQAQAHQDLGPPQCVLVWRKGHAVLRRVTTPRELAGLRAVQEGADFTDLCMALATFDAEHDADTQANHKPPSAAPEAYMASLATQVVSLIRGWVGAGLVRSCSGAPPRSP